jgi:peptidoglycan-associated lipoprotein
MQIRSSWTYIAVGAIALSGFGCAHVNREEMVAEHDALRDELTAEMLAGDEALARDVERLESSIGDLKADVAENSARLDALDRELEELRTEFGATIVRLEGMIAFNVPVHFDFDSSLLRDQDKGVLDKFAGVVDEYYAGSIVTVEGFADPAGDPEYNLRLGARRAEGVKSYLVEVAQLDVPIRAVSYGEAQDRQIKPGAWGAEGQANRRVTLVVDYRGVESGS